MTVFVKEPMSEELSAKSCNNHPRVSAENHDSSRKSLMIFNRNFSQNPWMIFSQNSQMIFNQNSWMISAKLLDDTRKVADDLSVSYNL